MPDAPKIENLTVVRTSLPETTNPSFFVNRATKRKFERLEKSKILTFKSEIYKRWSQSPVVTFKGSKPAEYDVICALVDAAGFQYVKKYVKDGLPHIDILRDKPK